MNGSSATASWPELKPFKSPYSSLLYHPRFLWLKNKFLKYFGNKYFAYNKSEKQKLFVLT